MISNFDKQVKFSNCKLVVYGDYLDLYIYGRKIPYNNPPMRSLRVSTIKNERRNDNVNNAKSKLRRLVLANSNAYGCIIKFLTLTFKDEIFDVKVANKFFTSFIQRFRYHFNVNDLKYNVVIEFQKNGRVHYHVLFYNLPFIKDLKKRLSDIWGQGFIKVKAVKNIKNISAYVLKYITKEFMDKRLIGQKVFFSSRGLIRPVVYRDSNIIKKVGLSQNLKELSTYIDNSNGYYSGMCIKNFKIIK